ncbi:MAG: insulinase family protein [Balneolaceae bacterium]|nr:insulinase family protein [Balneolaceae bacterium]
MKRTLLTVCMILISVSALAQKRYDEIKFPELNEFEKTKVEEFALDNGITFYLVEDKELPLIRVNVLVKTGSLLEPLEKTGLAGMTGQVMRNGGSENYPADELNLLLEDKAAFISTSIGMGSANASMNVLKEDFDDLVPVFVDLIRNPAFPQDKIDLAKTQLKTGISRRNDEQAQIANREFFKLIYGDNNPYTSQIEYATIDAITREDLVDFHEQAFTGNNMMIGVIGDFNTREMKRKLEAAFGNIEPGSETNLIYPEVDYNYPSTVNLVDKPDVNQSYIFAGHIGGLRENPDYAALQLMNEILSGGFSGRLMQTVRSDLGLAYAVFGSYSSNINYPGVFYVGVMTKSSTTAEAIDAMLSEVEKLQVEPVQQAELEEARERMLNSLIFRYDSKNKILNQRLNNEYNGLPDDYFDEYVEQLKTVSSADIQRVAKEYLQPDQVQILVVGNKAEIGDQLSKYGTVNEIDIEIPLPDTGEEKVAGDAAAGKEWLNKMADAIVEPGTEITSISVKTQTIQDSPMGSMTLGNDAVINYDEISMMANLTTPQGEIEMELKNGSGVMKMMGQEQQLPPMMTKPMFNEIKNSYLNIALKKDQFMAEYLGTEEVEGKEYGVLRVDGENTVTFLIDPDTGLPFLSRTNDLNPQTGAFATNETRYSNWQTNNGLTYAHSTVSFSDGNKVSETTTESVSIN